MPKRPEQAQESARKLVVLIDTWQARGVEVERLEHVKSLIDQRVADGHGSDGFSSLIEAIEDRRKDPS